MQDCKTQIDRVAAIYALGATAGPTLVARAYAVQQAMAAIDIVGAAASSAKVIELDSVLEEGSPCMQRTSGSS